MKDYHPSRVEQETTIRWDAAEKTTHLWSADPVTWRKMDKLGVQPTRESHSYGRLAGRWYDIPQGFSWSVRKSTPMTPEQRQRAADTLQKARLASPALATTRRKGRDMSRVEGDTGVGVEGQNVPVYLGVKSPRQGVA